MSLPEAIISYSLTFGLIFVFVAFCVVIPLLIIGSVIYQLRVMYKDSEFYERRMLKKEMKRNGNI